MIGLKRRRMNNDANVPTENETVETTVAEASIAEGTRFVINNEGVVSALNLQTNQVTFLREVNPNEAVVADSQGNEYVIGYDSLDPFSDEAPSEEASEE